MLFKVLSAYGSSFGFSLFECSLTDVQPENSRIKMKANNLIITSNHSRVQF